MGKQLGPVQKRGGVRRRAPRKPKNVSSRVSIFQDTKAISVFPKRLGQYRFVICTDDSPNSNLVLTLFAAWIKANEQFFDARNNFPFYGFVTSAGKTSEQHICDFLDRLGELLEWNNPEHQHYNGLQTARQRIWHDGETSDKETEPSLITSIDELLQAKPGNLFILYLRESNFLNDRPDVAAFLRQVPGVMYGSENSPVPLREPGDARLIYTRLKCVVSPLSAPKLFKEIDSDEAESFAQVMYAFNDQTITEFTERHRLTAELTYDNYRELLAGKSVDDSELGLIEMLLRHHSRVLDCSELFAAIAMFVGAGYIKKSPFVIEPASESNSTLIMRLKPNVADNDLWEFLQNTLYAAFRGTHL